MSAIQSPEAIHTLLALLERGEAELAKTVWPQLEARQYTVFSRILEAFAHHKVGEEHFLSVTGYGHSDMGREVTDRVFADALQAEKAIVRLQFVSGTHALAVALNGCLKTGDKMLTLTGKPYDTLEEVIGIRGQSPQSLIAKEVQYLECSVLKSGTFSLELTEAEKKLIRECDMAYIQRSRGYSLRPTLRISEIKALCERVRELNPKAIIMVDNCYGEFTEADEPTAVGADIIAGSLIKNPGGGLVPAGGYIAGRADLVESCASVLTCPGIGSEGGYTFDLTRVILQGLFQAPSVVKDALKGMTLAAWLFQELGCETCPRWDETRSDIIQVLTLGTREKLIRFCQTLQQASPVNSAVTPVPSPVPGYGDEIVMAGGTFIEGATLELSADGPLREPYAVFFQGGLSYAHTRYALAKILESLQS